MPRLSRIGWPPWNLKTSSMIEKLGDVVHRLTHAQTHVESLASGRDASISLCSKVIVV